MTDNALDVGAQLAELLNDKDYNAALRWSVLAASSEIAEVSIITGDRHDQLVIRFANSAELILADKGQSCCERRYLSCDDDLAGLAGGYLRGVEVANGPDEEGEYGECHEQMFLQIRTTKGDFTVVSHNEHNGYYGGISFDAEWVEP